MIRVYQYGLLAPLPECRDLVEAELRAGHNFRNEATAVARVEREAIRRAEVEHAPDIVDLRATIQRIDDEIAGLCKVLKEQRAHDRKRTNDDEFRLAISQLRVAKRDAIQLLNARCAEVDKQIKPTLNEIHERKLALGRVRNKGADCDGRRYRKCSWTTGGQMSKAVSQACGKSMYDEGQPSDPRFKRWDGSGQIGGQIQYGSGRKASDQFQFDYADHSERITLPPERRRGPKDDGVRRKLSTLRLRIGSDEKRKPVWATWPMVMHRPLPEDAHVTYVTVNRHIVGRREKWVAQFTVETETKREAAAGGVVAIDLGWKLVRDPLRPHLGTRLRLAVWVADDGEHGELALDEREVNGIAKANALRSQRDKNFELARDRLATWLGRRVVPEWLTKGVEFLGQWRSIARLTSVCRRWRDNRFDGDADGYDALEAWRYHDQHLWDWEVNQRSSGLLHRREVARILGAKLATKYATAVFTDAVYAQFKRGAKTEDDGEIAPSKSLLHVAAPGETRTAIVK